MVIIDSPGVDLDGDYDFWIENYCMDAEMFVLVVNAESTLMMREKNVFQKRSRRSRRTESKNRKEITKVECKKVKNEFSHCQTYFFLCSLLR